MTSRRDKLSELTTAEYLDSGRELVAALNPWINNGSHPSFLGLANGNESGMREAHDPGAYRTLHALGANLLCTHHFACAVTSRSIAMAGQKHDPPKSTPAPQRIPFGACRAHVREGGGSANPVPTVFEIAIGMSADDGDRSLRESSPTLSGYLALRPECV